MSTVVVGGGLIGLTTAYVLQTRGEAVTLLEAREGIALETSFANGGLLNPSMPEPWNGPGVFRRLFRSLFDSESSMRLRWYVVPSLFGWGIRFLLNSRKSRHAAICRENYPFLQFSLEKTREVVETLGLDYCRGTAGTLSVFRDPDDFQAKLRVCRIVEDLGLDYRVLTPAEVVAREPALAAIESKIHKGIHYPGDEHGDAHLFCRELLARFRAAGGEARFGVLANGFNTRNGKVSGVRTASAGIIDAERVVVAAGVLSANLLASAGVRLPVKPVKGYSVTVELDDTSGFPGLPVVDDSMHACITPFGNRLRMVGTADFAGFDYYVERERTDKLFALFEELFPSLADRADRGSAENWAGLRPMSYDGKPFIGASRRLAGLYANAGHGPLGWALAMGSAHLLADTVTGAAPELDPKPFALSRIGV